MAIDYSLINNGNVDENTQPHPLMTGLKDLGSGALYVAKNLGSVIALRLFCSLMKDGITKRLHTFFY